MSGYRVIISLLAVFVLAAALPVHASVRTFRDESSFLENLVTPSLESFEGLPATNEFVGWQRTLPDFTVEVILPIPPVIPADSLGVFDDPNTGQTPGAHATHGDNFLAYASDNDEILRFEFFSPQRAFGLNIIDWGDFGVGKLIFSNDIGASFEVAVAPLPDGNELFFGVISTGLFNRVDILNTVSGEGYAVDEAYYGSHIIPEPSTLAVWSLLATLGLSVLGRRRKS